MTKQQIIVRPFQPNITGCEYTAKLRTTTENDSYGFGVYGSTPEDALENLKSDVRFTDGTPIETDANGFITSDFPTVGEIIAGVSK